MAKMTYDEWFVKYKFPGHEEVKIVNSEYGKIPEGWQIKPMNQIAEVIDCLHSKKPTLLEEGSNLFLQLDLSLTVELSENTKIVLTSKNT